MKRPAPIRRRLVYTLIAAALFAFAIAAAGWWLLENLNLERRVRDVAEPYARIASVGAEAAVAFGDTTRAGEILAGLEANPRLVGAQIVLADGRVLARAGGRAVDWEAAPRSVGLVPLAGGDTALLSEALNDGALLQLVVDTAALRRESLEGLPVFAASTLVLLGVLTLGLLAVLQRGIVRPITALASAADEVRKHADYSRRVAASGSDELMRLGETFNAMMDALEQRDEALSRHREELEEIVLQRTLELRQARDAAEAASRAKSSFLANMSHEIRTPIAAILGLTDLAVRSGMPPQARDYVRRAHGSAQSLLGILNDILDISKIEAGRLAFEHIPFSPADVLDRLVGMVAIAAEEKGLELLVSAPARLPTALVGDPLRLGQVLLNLTGNAIKFTDHGEVRVSVAVEEPPPGEGDGVRLHFEVADTGMGMSPEVLSRLFEPFAQGDASTSRRFGGTGLGLAISRQLVRMMGGELKADSAPGRGSRFSFSLSFARAEDAPAEAVQTDPVMRGQRVLVAGGSTRARDLTARLAGELGLDVDSAADAQQALARLREADAGARPFRVVILDAGAEPGDAVTALREMQAPGVLKNPVAAMLVTTARRREALEQTLAQEGLPAAAFLLDKPILPAALRCACGTALRGGSPASEAALPGREEEAVPAGLRGARVLLVEDNEIIREIAITVLEVARMEVIVARNGAEALDAVSRERFDVVLMDCQMPVMDGYEATRAMRRRPELRELPILAMTANAMVGDRAAALEAGMNDHITKPFRIDEMLATLERWVAIGKARARRTPSAVG